MFNWVCPRCGKDVPPSKTECPYCAGAAQPQAPQQAPPQVYPAQGYPPPPQAAPWQPPAGNPQPPQAWQPPQQWAPPAAAQPEPPPPVPPQGPPPPPQAAWAPQPPPPHVHPHPEQMAHTHWPPQKQGPPAWLVGGGVAAALLVLLGGAYYFLQPGTGKTEATEKTTQQPGATAAANDKAAANPLQKYVEVVGIRIVTQDKKPVAKIVVINHSTAEINDLEANVTLWASTKRSEEDSIGTFRIKVRSVPPNGSADTSAPLTTKLKTYELPDWQNLTAEIQITSPQP